MYGVNMDPRLSSLLPYALPSNVSSAIQSFGNTAGVVVLVTLTYSSPTWLWLITWPLTLILLMRQVIIEHDCGHYSYFTSKLANDMVGHLSSVLTTIPFGYWKLTHDTHHQNQSNLSARSDTEYPTLTVNEYQNLTQKEQKKYRLTRSPIGVCLIIPLLLLLGIYRFPNAIARRQGLTTEMLMLTLLLWGMWGIAWHFSGALVGL